MKFSIKISTIADWITIITGPITILTFILSAILRTEVSSPGSEAFPSELRLLFFILYTITSLTFTVFITLRVFAVIEDDTSLFKGVFVDASKLALKILVQAIFYTVFVIFDFLVYFFLLGQPSDYYHLTLVWSMILLAWYTIEAVIVWQWFG